MHYIVPYNIPGRTANEAVMNETVDLTEIKKYVDKKNAGGEEFKYTFFHVIAAAIAKTIVLRPKMNYFYSGNRLWEKKRGQPFFCRKEKACRRLARNSCHDSLPEGRNNSDRAHPQ